jgi:hypothetical protein
MQTFIVAICLLTFVVTESVACYKGLDLKKRSSWLYGVISFLSGLVLGFSLGNDLIEILELAVLFTVFTLLGGVVMRRHKQKYEGRTGPLLLKYGKEDDTSFFAKIVRRLLNKYK